MEGVEIDRKDSMNQPVCRAVAHGHLDVVRLLGQQGARMNVNESTIAAHHTALCMAAHGGELDMVQALLRHGQIDVNLSDQWFEDPLILAVKGGHFSIFDALVVNSRQKYLSLKRSLDLARNDCIQRAIRSTMEDDNTPQTLLKRPPRRRFGGL
jgi:ankyrin repeat protein